MFKNYDPQSHILNFAGFDISGFADGTFISIERAEDAYSMAVGSTGDVTRVRSRNRTGSVTITLQQSMPVNELLSAQALKDEADNTGAGDLLIKDSNGTLVARAEVAWIKKLPKIDRAKEQSNIEWVIDCADLVIENVGSSSV